MSIKDNATTHYPEARLRWLPRPGMTLFLIIIWLLLNNTAAPGHIILGTVIGLFIPILIHPLMPPAPRLRRPLLALKYTVIVVYDIIISNLEVALLICGRMGKLTPGIIAIPLDLNDELPITLLANTISLTPGTVSAELSSDKRWLYVHALHLQDEQATINKIKTRYEQPLQEIFTCSK